MREQVVLEETKCDTVMIKRVGAGFEGEEQSCGHREPRKRARAADGVEAKGKVECDATNPCFTLRL